MNEKMIMNYKINYFLSNILLLEMIIKNLYNTLNKTKFKNNYHIKNSSYIFILFKFIFYYLYYCVLYYNFIKSKGENYKNNLINYPDNYIKITDYIGKNILKLIGGNGCYCENEIIIDKEYSEIKFNLLFSGLEIKIDLFKLFNSIDNKICNSDQNLNCKIKNKNIELELNNNMFKSKFNLMDDQLNSKFLSQIKTFGTLERKYHTSTRAKNKEIEIKESDFQDKEKKFNNSIFNILEKIKYLTSTPYNSREVQQLIEDH